jgi:hypothetical protein
MQRRGVHANLAPRRASWAPEPWFFPSWRSFRSCPMAITLWASRSAPAAASRNTTRATLLRHAATGQKERVRFEGAVAGRASAPASVPLPGIRSTGFRRRSLAIAWPWLGRQGGSPRGATPSGGCSARAVTDHRAAGARVAVEGRAQCSGELAIDEGAPEEGATQAQSVRDALAMDLRSKGASSQVGSAQGLAVGRPCAVSSVTVRLGNEGRSDRGSWPCPFDDSDR